MYHDSPTSTLWLSVVQLHLIHNLLAPWAARYYTWLFIKIDAKRRSLFFFFFLGSVGNCGCVSGGW